MLARLQSSTWKITETYTYKHDIGTRQRIEHTDSIGEISIRFPYDGKACSDLVPTKHKEAPGKSQGENGLVTVGFLSVDNAPAAQPITLQIENPEDSLTRVDVYRKSYSYRVQEPPFIPLRIEARIIDEPQTGTPISQFFEAHGFASGLNMALRLAISMPVEKLHAPASLYRHLQQILRGQRKENYICVPPADHRNRESLSRKLSALADSGGGLLLFGISDIQSITGVGEAELAELSGLVESVALTLDPPLAINPPSRFIVEEKHLLIIEVPKAITEEPLRREALFYANGQPYLLDEAGNVVVASSGGQTKINDNRPSAYDTRRFAPALTPLNSETAEREISKGPSGTICFIGLDTSKLADFQAALANTGGGHIFYGVQSQGIGRPGEIVGIGQAPDDAVAQLVGASHQWAGRLSQPYSVKIRDKTVIIQDIITRAPDLYRGSTGFCTFDGVGFKQLEDRAAMEILRDRKGAVGSILPKPVPLLRRLSLSWIEFPFKSELYNAETGCIEWLDIGFKEDPGKSGSFTCELHTPIARAKELLDRKSITGEIEVEIGDVLLSSTPIRAYDALGFQSSPEWQITTRVRSEVLISLEPVLQQRSFYPVRCASVLGIEPRPERLREIIRILNDSGIMVDEHFAGDYQHMSIIRGVDLKGEKQGSLGTTTIYCRIAGTPSTVKRRLRSGQQIDDKQLSSGSISLTFYIDTEESHGNVIALLNEVVGNIHRRFDHLKVE